MPLLNRCLVLLLPLMLMACAHSPAHDPRDPLEPMNRAIYKFNTVADKYVVKPVAKGYDTVTPDPVQQGVRNFFSNLFYPVTIVNQYAQGKFKTGTKDLGRFVVNSTVGLAGLIDVAQHWGMPANSEDFGQTLGHWGVGEGWYLMLPFLGPSSNRDLFGQIVDAPLSPLYYSPEEEAVLAATLLNAVQLRVDLLPADALLEEQSDPYTFLRSTYWQARKSAINDGAPVEENEDELDAMWDDFEG